MTWQIIEGDCREVMAGMEAGSVDAVVCDPPYNLGFMGMAWDTLDGREGGGQRRGSDVRFDHVGGNHNPVDAADAARTRSVENRKSQAWHEAWAHEALRVLKPGGFLIAFGGTRTYHRLTCAIEDAGFEIRDTLMWLFGSGFPKSLNPGKSMNGLPWRHPGDFALREAAAWSGHGTALKPAFEPIVLARKPLAGTVAGNVLEHGTGALNVDGCRIEGAVPQVTQGAQDAIYGNGKGLRSEPTVSNPHSAGRWPANVVLDEEAAAMLDEQTGTLVSGPESDKGHRRNADREAQRNAYGGFQGQEVTGVLYGDRGGASRFFYIAKASRSERGEGNTHPTVKPIDLMRWLVRLVTPPDGLVLDPFAGSGTTGIASLREGFSFVGIEREPDYVDLVRTRIRDDAPLLNTPVEVAA